MFIETLVFFDIETTGLPQLEKNRTKITELTFLAASRRDIEKTAIDDIPLINKLSLLFNPQKNIQATASKITGLTNTALQNQPIFKNKISCINSFLENLSKPVCLVAHNGNRFDYKILQAEYLDANEKLPVDIHCVDSMTGFRKILKDTKLTFNDLKAESSKTLDGLLTDDDDDWPKLNTTLEDWQEIDELCDSFTSNSISPIKSSIKNLEVSPKRDVKTKAVKSSIAKCDKIVYKLSDLYKRLLNRDVIESHRAEADCLMLLQCVVATKKEFLPWADSQCKLLDKIEPLKRW